LLAGLFPAPELLPARELFPDPGRFPGPELFAGGELFPGRGLDPFGLVPTDPAGRLTNSGERAAIGSPALLDDDGLP
jgi:hypothetical protein